MASADVLHQMYHIESFRFFWLNIPVFYHSLEPFSSMNVPIILEGTSVLGNLPRFILYCQNNTIVAEKQPPYLGKYQVTSPFSYVWLSFLFANRHYAKIRSTLQTSHGLNTNCLVSINVSKYWVSNSKRSQSSFCHCNLTEEEEITLLTAMERSYFPLAS